MSLKSLRKEIRELIESETHVTEQINDSVDELIEIIKEEQEKLEAAEAGMRGEDDDNENGNEEAGCDDNFDEEH